MQKGYIIMKKTLFRTIILSVFCMLLASFPAFAGEWIEETDDQWRYIEDDGSYATGWLDIDDERYFFDEDGYRQDDVWKKEGRYWYYLQEDGTMAANTWVDNYYVDETGRFEKKR